MYLSEQQNKGDRRRARHHLDERLNCYTAMVHASQVHDACWTRPQPQHVCITDQSHAHVARQATLQEAEDRAGSRPGPNDDIVRGCAMYAVAQLYRLHLDCGDAIRGGERFSSWLKGGHHTSMQIEHFAK